MQRILLSILILILTAVKPKLANSEELTDETFSVWNCALAAARGEVEVEQCTGVVAKSCIESVTDEMLAAGGNPGISVSYGCEVAELGEWTNAWATAVGEVAWRDGDDSLRKGLERNANALRLCSQVEPKPNGVGMEIRSVYECLAEELVEYLRTDLYRE